MKQTKSHRWWNKRRKDATTLLNSVSRLMEQRDQDAMIGLLADRAGDTDPKALKARSHAIRFLAASRNQAAFELLGPLVDTRWDSFGLRHTLLQLAAALGDTEQQARQLTALQELCPVDEAEGARALRDLKASGLDVVWLERKLEHERSRITPYSAAKTIERVSPSQRFVVNIGCHDGKSWGDPCYELYADGWPGIAIDAGEHPGLLHNLPSSDIKKLQRTPVSPDTVVEILAGAGCPRAFTLLKIDIDSFDGPVLRSILTTFDPDLIYIEVNTEIPPPIAFAAEYDVRVKPSAFGGFSGCSIAYVQDVARSHRLLSLDFADLQTRRDMLMIRANLIEHFLASGVPLEAEAAFQAIPARRSSFWDIGIDSREWRRVNDQRALISLIWDACCEASIARSGRVLPFHLYSVSS